MDIKFYKTKIDREVITPLKEYRKECGKDSGYTRFHVLKCKHILINYLKKLNRICGSTDEKIMNTVKWAVLALNKLNEQTEYCLIETDARESIWEIMQNAAIDSGLKEYDEDITEEWREW